MFSKEFLKFILQSSGIKKSFLIHWQMRYIVWFSLIDDRIIFFYAEIENWIKMKSCLFTVLKESVLELKFDQWVVNDPAKCIKILNLDLEHCSCSIKTHLLTLGTWHIFDNVHISYKEIKKQCNYTIWSLFQCGLYSVYLLLQAKSTRDVWSRSTFRRMEGIPSPR
jgi:hypothetical protein